MHKIRNIFKSVLREDLKSFVVKVFRELNPGEKFIDGYHIDLICDYLQRAMKGENNRLIINIPPRQLKSIICSVAAPAFILGHNPSAKIMCISYGEELASKLASQCKSIMTTKWYNDLFPNTVLSSNKNSIMDFETTLHGGRYATTMGGSITGRGADYIFIDDPQKPMDAASDTMREKINDIYSSTISSRLNDKNNGKIILIMQRLHQHDLTGYLIEKELDYKLIKLPLIAEEDENLEIRNHRTGKIKYIKRRKGDILHAKREGIKVIEEIKKSLSSFEFSSQYQQNPAPVGGGLIKKEWLKFYERFPLRLKRIVISWDTGAKTSDTCSYSACVVIGQGEDNKYFLMDVYRIRLEFQELVKTTKGIIYHYEQRYPGKAVILIENASSGIQLFQCLRQKWRNVKSIGSIGSKEQRFNIVILKTEQGDLLFPSDYKPWYKDFENELLTFPKSQFNDQCDALSQALNYLSDNKGSLSSTPALAARAGGYTESQLGRADVRHLVAHIPSNRRHCTYSASGSAVHIKGKYKF